jgi:hypothetical protein
MNCDRFQYNPYLQTEKFKQHEQDLLQPSMDWNSDNNNTLSRAGSPHRSEDNPNFENNGAASVLSNRVDVYSNRFSDLEEDFMDISDGDLDLDLQSSKLDNMDSTGNNAGSELMDVEQDEAFSGSEFYHLKVSLAVSSFNPF